MSKNYLKSLLMCAAGCLLLLESSAGRAQQISLNPGNGISRSLIKEQRPASKIAGSVSRPTTSQDYIMSQGSWRYMGNSLYTYDANGYMSERLVTDPVTNQNENKMTYVFDADGNELENTFAIWSNSSWQVLSGNKEIRTKKCSGEINRGNYSEVDEQCLAEPGKSYF